MGSNAQAERFTLGKIMEKWVRHSIWAQMQIGE